MPSKGHAMPCSCCLCGGKSGRYVPAANVAHLVVGTGAGLSANSFGRGIGMVCVVLRGDWDARSRTRLESGPPTKVPLLGVGERVQALMVNAVRQALDKLRR